jgi:hypothetical protein
MEKLTNEILKYSSWKVTPEQSDRLQELAFGLGFEWNDHTSEVKHTQVENLYFDDDLFFASDEEYPRFERKEFKDWFKEEEDKEYPNPIPEYPKPVELPKGKLTYIEGTFAWAVEKMEKGEKLRRRNWTVPTYVSLDMLGGEDNYKFTCDMLNTINFVFSYYSVTARDWEIYEEKAESLSDKFVLPEVHVNDERKYTERCVKETVRNLKKDFCKMTDENNLMSSSMLTEINSIINKRFGEKLI